MMWWLSVICFAWSALHALFALHFLRAAKAAYQQALADQAEAARELAEAQAAVATWFDALDDEDRAIVTALHPWLPARLAADKAVH